jgi:hypothetical protein
MRDERRRESVLVGYGLQPPVAVELPAMKRTGELRHAASVVESDAIPAMRADVVEGLDGRVGLADEDDLFRADLEHRVIAMFWNVRDNTRKQPDAWPHVLPFELHELARVKPRGVDHGEPVVDVGLFRLQAVRRRVERHRPGGLQDRRHRCSSPEATGADRIPSIRKRSI